MTKIVVTGADGFLGKYVTQVLSKKRGVIVSKFEKGKHSLEEYSSMKSLLKGSSVIVHLAGLNRADDHEILRVNTLGTHGLLKAIALYSPGIRIVYASSQQVYDARSVYGLSKFFAEKLIENYANKDILEGVVLRFSNLYGPGAKPFYNSVIATFSTQIKSGKQITIHGTGLMRRDFLYVTDAADIVLKSLSHTLKDNFLQLDVCSGRKVSVRKIVSLMQRYVSQEIKIYYSHEESDTIRLRKSNRKTAKEIFGWLPDVSLEEGIEKVMSSV